MHDFLLSLKDVAPAAFSAVFVSSVMLLAACACYALFLLFVVPRIETRDPGGWGFAGALTLSVAFLIFQAATGQGKGYETLKDAAPALGICLGTVVTALLAYKGTKVIAARPPAPIVPTTVTTTTARTEPAPVTAGATTTVTTEQKTEAAP